MHPVAVGDYVTFVNYPGATSAHGRATDPARRPAQDAGLAAPDRQQPDSGCAKRLKSVTTAPCLLCFENILGGPGGKAPRRVGVRSTAIPGVSPLMETPRDVGLAHRSSVARVTSFA